MSGEAEPAVAFPTRAVELRARGTVRAVGQWSQFSGLYARELLRTFRNPWVLVITIVQPFMWLAFFGSSFGNVPKSYLEGLFGTTNYI